MAFLSLFIAELIYAITLTICQNDLSQRFLEKFSIKEIQNAVVHHEGL